MSRKIYDYNKCYENTWIQLSVNPGEIYCKDSYETVIKKLEESYNQNPAQ